VPQHIARVGHVALVGGGLGVAPVYPQLRAFKRLGNRTTSIIGFRSCDRIFWEERLRELSDRLVLCTDDGSRGRQGFVTAALDEAPACAVRAG
jgi:NAD(P)H-flavin reductase